jgi:hypothetical protein
MSTAIPELGDGVVAINRALFHQPKLPKSKRRGMPNIIIRTITTHFQLKPFFWK